MIRRWRPSVTPPSGRGRVSGLARPELLASTELARRAHRAAGAPDPRRPLAARRQRPGGPRRRPHPGCRPSRLAGRSDRPAGGRRAAPGRPGPGRERASALRGQRRRDGRHLRRHGGAVRVPDLVEHPRLRPRVGPDPRRRLPGLGGRGPPDLERRSRRPPTAVHAAAQPRCGSRRRTCARCSGPRRRAHRRARAGRVPRLRGQYEAARAHPGRGQRARRRDEASPAATLRDGGDCATMLLKANVSRGKRMVCYDGSGVAAAKLAFALTPARPRRRRGLRRRLGRVGQSSGPARRPLGARGRARGPGARRSRAIVGRPWRRRPCRAGTRRRLGARPAAEPSPLRRSRRRRGRGRATGRPPVRREDVGPVVVEREDVACWPRLADRVRPVRGVGDRDERPVSSVRASWSSRCGSRWMRPVMRNGGIVIIAISGPSAS